jgi:hypothetical protein
MVDIYEVLNEDAYEDNISGYTYKASSFSAVLCRTLSVASEYRTGILTCRDCWYVYFITTELKALDSYVL